MRAISRDLASGVRAGRGGGALPRRRGPGDGAGLRAGGGRRGLGTVVLSGGVFQNRLLLERTAGRLEGACLRVLVPERLPPNDGGISYGQAAVAAARRGG